MELACQVTYTAPLGSAAQIETRGLVQDIKQTDKDAPTFAACNDMNVSMIMDQIMMYWRGVETSPNGAQCEKRAKAGLPIRPHQECASQTTIHFRSNSP